MNLIKIEIKGSNSQIEKFIRNFTDKGKGALVFEVTRIPSVGEKIQLNSDWETEVFRVTEVIHYTVSSWCSAWGCITVEPCNLLPIVTDEDEEFEADDDEIIIVEDEEFEADDDEIIIVEDEEFEADDDEIIIVEDEEFEADDDEIIIVDDEEFEADDDEIIIDQDSSLPNKRSYYGRLPRGICTPQEDYKLPILKALDDLGGSARTKTVLRQVKKLMKGTLKRIDYQNYINQQGSYTIIEPRWQKNAKWARYHLMKEGFVKSNSPRGVWEISKAGRQYLADNKDND